MKTVLFVWELGEGLGHVAPLVAISDALIATAPETRPVFAFCDPVFGRIGLGARGYRILPVPVPPAGQDVRSRSASYADLLAIFGFGDPHYLGLALQAWDDLYATCGPDLVVTDHSPTACLAARGRIPVLVTGNGFTVPPADLTAYPPLQTDQQASRNQAVVLQSINQVLTQRDVPALSRLPELLQGDARAVFTLPQLDPYQQFRSEPVLGPYADIDGPIEPPDTPSIFFYSRSDQDNIDAIANALWQCGLPVSSFVRGGRTVGTTFLENMGARIHDTPPPLREAFPAASIVVSHGGGLAQAALKAGRPQVIIPNHLEATITGRRIEALGAGVVVEVFDGGRLAEAIARVNGDARYQANASAVAEAIAAMPLPRDAASAAAAMCVELLADHPPA